MQKKHVRDAWGRYEGARACAKGPGNQHPHQSRTSAPPADSCLLRCLCEFDRKTSRFLVDSCGHDPIRELY